ncbi:MAG TPA: hypothetical protein VH170_04275 [Chthoniobacterales bacterium]|nr:hypothetical protein [Chthoniobacterales bacterium]
MPAVATLIAVAVALFQYRNSKKEEFRKRFWEEQYALYSKAVSAAALIATAKDFHSIAAAREEFWRLYWGALCMVEDREVEAAMVDFGEVLAEAEKAGDISDRPATGNARTKFRDAAYYLAHSMRESLSRTWQPVDLGKLSGLRPVE